MKLIDIPHNLWIWKQPLWKGVMTKTFWNLILLICNAITSQISICRFKNMVFKWDICGFFWREIFYLWNEERVQIINDLPIQTYIAENSEEIRLDMTWKRTSAFQCGTRVLKTYHRVHWKWFSIFIHFSYRHSVETVLRKYVVPFITLCKIAQKMEISMFMML